MFFIKILKQSVLVLVGTAAFASNAFSADGEIIIGFLPPLTGAEAIEGAMQIKSLDLAVKRVNAEGGIDGKKLKVVTEDNKSSPQGAAAAFDALVANDKVFAIVGPIKSVQILALAPKANKVGIPLFMGGTNPRLTTDGSNKWVFRMRPNDAIAAGAMARYFKESGYKKIGIIADTGAFGSGGANLVEKNLKDLGLTLVRRENFPQGEKDVGPRIKALKDAGAEAVAVYIANTEDVVTVQKEWAKAGRPFVYLGSPSSVSKVTTDLTKGAAEGVLGITDVIFGQSEASKKFLEEYRAEYKEDPDTLHSYTYDSVILLAKAIKAAGLKRDGVRSQLASTNGYQGVMGTYNFDQYGDGLHAVTVVKFEGGKIKSQKVVNVQ